MRKRLFEYKGKYYSTEEIRRVITRMEKGDIIRAASASSLKKQQKKDKKRGKDINE